MPTTKKVKSACVVVLGDLGRSPRMCNHALSLADHDFRVHLVGYPGSALPSEVQEHENVTVRHVRPYPAGVASVLHRLVNYAVKVVWQALTLLFALLSTGGPDVLFLQNPPSVPAIAVCYFYAKILRWGKTKLAVDWHNYGYTILSMALGPKHPLVGVNRFVERFFGARADLSFCVTKAMKQDLSANWGVTAETLYDRAPVHFRARSLEEKHALFLRLGADYPAFLGEGDDAGTAFTEEYAQGRVELREDRPAMLVSSTSWTEDEDFSVLLEALQDYEDACRSGASSQLPNLLVAITGKGPLKEYYRDLISRQGLRHVTVVMPWLEPDDYPLLLACADLGVSLHTSSSGLDLPMKVVDMFGCGLPVCALNFPALPELVRHEENGMVFEDSSELSGQIKRWFTDFPNGEVKRREAFRESLKKFQRLRWEENWEKVALPEIVKVIKHL